MRKLNPYKFLTKKERRDKLINDCYYELDQVFHLVELDLWCDHYVDRRYAPIQRNLANYRYCMCRYYRLWLYGEANGVKVAMRFHVRYLVNRLEYSVVVSYVWSVGVYTYDEHDVRDAKDLIRVLGEMNYQPALSLHRKQIIDEILLDV